MPQCADKQREEGGGNTSEIALFEGDGELQRCQLLPVRQPLCGLRCAGRCSMLARLSAGTPGRVTRTQPTPDECAGIYAPCKDGKTTRQVEMQRRVQRALNSAWARCNA